METGIYPKLQRSLNEQHQRYRDFIQESILVSFYVNGNGCIPFISNFTLLKQYSFIKFNRWFLLTCIFFYFKLYTLKYIKYTFGVWIIPVFIMLVTVCIDFETCGANLYIEKTKLTEDLKFVEHIFVLKRTVSLSV